MVGVVVGDAILRKKERLRKLSKPLILLAGVTRLELAAFPSCLTGRSNQPFYVIAVFAILDSLLSFHRIRSF